jgi:hypothetical protein
MADNTGLSLSREEANIKLVPINPTVRFVSTNDSIRITTTSSEAPTFVPVIDIRGKKYFPVYMKQPSADSNPQVRFDIESVLYLR